MKMQTKENIANTGVPPHADVYVTHRGGKTRITYSYFDGKAWHWDHFDPKAAREQPYVSNFQKRYWAPITH